MTRISLLVLVAAVAALVIAGLRGRSRPVGSSPPLRERDDGPLLRLVLITDLEGTLEPCGCTLGGLGGLDRLARSLEGARTDRTPAVVLVAGPLFVDPHREGMPRPQDILRQDALARILGDLHVAAAGLSTGDVELGEQRLGALHGMARIPFLCAGVLAKEPEGARRYAPPAGGAISSATLTVTRGRRVGIVGVARGSASEDRVALASLRVGELRAAGAESIVVLSSGESGFAGVLAERANADVIVEGGVSEPVPSFVRAPGRALIVRAGRRAEHFAVADLLALRDEHGEARWSVRFESVPFDGPRDPGVEARIADYDERVRETNARSGAFEEPPPPGPGRPGYVGARPCASCHTAEYLWWTRTKHARAFAALESRRRELDLDCVGCHVTGYGKPGGSTVTRVDQLKNVGCESCHGAGGIHVEDARPSRHSVQRSVDESVCRGCHTSEQSPAFDYASARTSLIAPGHGLPL